MNGLHNQQFAKAFGDLGTTFRVVIVQKSSEDGHDRVATLRVQVMLSEIKSFLSRTSAQLRVENGVDVGLLVQVFARDIGDESVQSVPKKLIVHHGQSSGPHLRLVKMTNLKFKAIFCKGLRMIFDEAIYLEKEDKVSFGDINASQAAHSHCFDSNLPNLAILKS